MNLKEKYAYYQLRKKLDNTTRKVELPRLASLTKVGVLWQPEQRDAFNFLHDYFTNSKVIFRNICICGTQEPPVSGSSSVTKKDCNWFGIPVASQAEQFIKTGFDALFNISLEQNLQLDYITALSEAKFKIGTSEKKSNFFDLNININGKRDALYLAEQQIFYLGELNKTKNNGRTF